MTSNKATYSPVRNGDATTGKSVLFNGITSTPLPSPRSRLSNSLFSTSRTMPLRTPPRYSLSETSSQPESDSKNKSSLLLKSSKYNSNLAAYTDGNSPGLHSRVVQYSNEARDNLPITHQAKYGSPGLFPVVHFFKKDLPVISPKPKKVMVRLASPDVHWYSNTSYNKQNLSDSGEVRNGHHSPQISTDTETRSVLDALREISRKRIHTDSEFEGVSDATCKKQKRTDSDTESYENNKRAREDSPKSDTSRPSTPSVHQTKKICIVDVLAASYTSSRLLKEKMQNASKRKPEVEFENPREQKEPKRQTSLSNAETQTTNVEPNVVPPKLPDTSISISNKKLEESNVAKDGLKENAKQQEETALRYSNIFDEKKLEVHRRNKLALLIGALTGEKPNLISYERLDEEKSEKEPSSENKLVSILSPTNKTKHDKHVHFNLTPEVKSIDNTTPVSSEIITVNSTVEPSKDNIVNNETPRGIQQSKPSFNINFGSLTQTTSATLSTTTTTTSTLSCPIVTTIITTTTTKKNESSDVNPISNLSFSFGKPPVSNNLETPKKAAMKPNSQVSGGFKFNLSPTNNTTSPPPSMVSAVPQELTAPKSGANLFSFGETKTTVVTTASLPSSINNSLNAASKNLPPNFGTGLINFAASKSTSNLPTFGKNATTTSASSNSMSVLTATPSTTALEIKNDSTKTSNPSALFNALSAPTTSTITTSQPVVSQPMFTFGGNTTSVFGMPTTTTSQFGEKQASVSEKAVTSNTGFNATTCTPAFGINNSATPSTSVATGFGTITTPSAFGNTSGPCTSTSGVTVPTPIPDFGTTPSNTSFPTTSTSFTTATSTSIFASNTTTPNFGLNTSGGFPTAPPPFGSSSSAFGTPTIPSTSAGVLSKPSGPTFNFGSGNNFGTTEFGGNMFGPPVTSAPAFGNTTTTTTAFGGFGAPSMTSTGFGTFTTNTAAFGNTGNEPSKFSNPGFGVPNTTAALTRFGTNSVFVPTTTTSSGFGSSGTFGNTSQPNAVFGNSNAFGTKTSTTASSGFGTSTFGVTTTASSGFGTNPIGFGNQSFFGKTTTAGFTPTTTAASGFVSNNASTNKTFNFNTATSNNAGFNNSSSFNFGANNPSGFAENKQATFASFPTNGFGSNTSTITSTTTNSTTSIFGSTSGFGNSTGFGTSTFAASSNNPAPAFGNNASVFNSPNNNTFGAPPNNNNAFGSSSSVPNFGFGNGDASSTFAKPQAPTGFGMGSGDSTFQFGSGNNVSAPVFGAVNPSNNTSAGAGQVFSFGANNPTTSSSAGVFAFGTPEQKSNFPNNNNTSAFQTGASTFGSNPVAGNFGTPQFGTPTAGMFSIGSGSSTGPRQRYLKAKRRT